MWCRRNSPFFQTHCDGEVLPKENRKKTRKNNAERTLMRLGRNSPFYLRTLRLREAHREKKITSNDRNAPIYSTRFPVRWHKYQLALNFMLTIIKTYLLSAILRWMLFNVMNSTEFEWHARWCWIYRFVSNWLFTFFHFFAFPKSVQIARINKLFCFLFLLSSINQVKKLVNRGRRILIYPCRSCTTFVNAWLRDKRKHKWLFSQKLCLYSVTVQIRMNVLRPPAHWLVWRLRAARPTQT